MLNLSPETESRLSEYAAREGVNPDEAINRLLHSAVATSNPKDEAAPVEDTTLAFLQSRIAEAEKATPGEVAQAEEDYKQWQQNMNEPRRGNGERLLFPEAVQP